MNGKSILRCFLLLALLPCIYYVSPNILEHIKDIKNISMESFLILSVLYISIQFLLGIEIKVLCKVFGIHLSITECFGLSAVRSLANYLPMGAGAVSNALYLKNQKDLSIAYYTSSLSVSLILMLMTASFIGFWTTVYFAFGVQPVRIELSFLFLFIFTGSLAMMFVKIPLIYPHSFVTKQLKNFQNGVSLLRKDKKALKNLIVLKFVILLISTVQAKIIFDSINYSIELGVIILIVMSISALTIITILPGNIGFAESLSGIIASLSGSTFAYGFIGIATGRIIQMIWIFVLGAFFLLYFVYKLNGNPTS